MATKWETTKVPKVLIDRIDEHVKSGLYNSRMDFMKEAIRLRLDMIDNKFDLYKK